MLYNQGEVRYKDFGEIWNLGEIEGMVNDFLKENPGITVVMFEQTGGDGLWGAHMFYKLPTNLEEERNK